jgi:hypothetical protein
VPLDGGDLRVLLLDPDASKHAAFENLLCIAKNGNLVWKAKLPTSPDAFLDVAVTSEGLQTSTWSGFTILLDSTTGAELKRTFAK